LTVKGYVRVRLNGKLVAEGSNVVTTAGKALLAQLLAQESALFPSHLAIGSASDAPDESQTTLLGTEHQRVALGSVSTSNNELVITAQIPASGRAGTVAVQEYGIFNDAVAGVLLARFVSVRQDLVTTGVMDIEWRLTLG